MPPSVDSDLIEPAESGTAAHAWVARLLKTEGPGILRLLWRKLGQEADVLDAYQETFLRLANCSRRLNPKRAKSYAYRTAMNIAIDIIRARGRREAHAPAVQAFRALQVDELLAREVPLAQWAESELLEALRQAIAQLPPQLRNVIALRDLGMKSYKEVAQLLGIDATTARVYRRHAVLRLMDLLRG
jgi:RNA polymerase sigma factor (sigma-70 family)